MDKIAVLILAAGKSSRMKSIKQLAKIQDKYLLEITIEKAQEIAPNNTYCVLGANADVIKNEIDFKHTKTISNTNYKKGLSTSIICGVNFLKKEKRNTKALLILLADQPGVEVSYLKEMIDLYRNHPTKIIASQYNIVYGVPALIPSIFFAELLLIKGDKGAKIFLNNHPDIVLSPKEKTNLTDIDTLEQLKLYINS